MGREEKGGADRRGGAGEVGARERRVEARGRRGGGWVGCRGGGGRATVTRARATGITTGTGTATTAGTGTGEGGGTAARSGMGARMMITCSTGRVCRGGRGTAARTETMIRRRTETMLLRSAMDAGMLTTRTVPENPEEGSAGEVERRMLPMRGGGVERRILRAGVEGRRGGREGGGRTAKKAETVGDRGRHWETAGLRRAAAGGGRGPGGRRAGKIDLGLTRRARATVLPPPLFALSLPHSALPLSHILLSLPLSELPTLLFMQVPMLSRLSFWLTDLTCHFPSAPPYTLP